MSKPSVSNAFSAGIGLAMGMTMAQYMSQAMRPSEKIIKQVIVCLKCGGKNSIENKFCGQCGRALYPPLPVKCPRCMAMMPSKTNFCGRCGSPLRETKRIRKKKGTATS